jgi:hypothetical protein
VPRVARSWTERGGGAPRNFSKVGRLPGALTAAARRNLQPTTNNQQSQGFEAPTRGVRRGSPARRSTTNNNSRLRRSDPRITTKVTDHQFAAEPLTSNEQLATGCGLDSAPQDELGGIHWALSCSPVPQR